MAVTTRRRLARLALPMRRLGVWPYVAALGPGLVSANAGNDAGGIATYAAAGAAYGYTLLWALAAVTVSLVVVQEMCARMGAVTGEGLSELIRERFSIRWTALATLGLFVANAGVAMSEFMGIAAAGELFGIPRIVLVPACAAGLWLLVLRGSYPLVERAFLALTLAFFAYPVAAWLARPDWEQVARGSVVPTLPLTSSGIATVMALIGTTITPYMQLFLQSSVAERGVPAAMYRYQRFDVVFGSIFGNVIAATIIVATAATLFTQGVPVETAADAARALEPVAGAAATYLFGGGLFGACMLAAAVLPLTTAYAVCEAFGFEKGVSFSFREAPQFLTIFTAVIVLGALAALIPGLPFIQVIVLVQVVNGMLLPIVLVAALRLTNDPRVMGEHRNGPLFNAIAVLTVSVVVLLSTALLALTVLELAGVRPGG